MAPARAFATQDARWVANMIPVDAAGATRADAPTCRRSVFWTLAFAVTLLSAVSRGVGEAVAGKQVAYGAQLIVLVTFVTLLVLRGGWVRRRTARGATVWLYIFLLAATASALLSSFVNAIDYSAPYLVVMFVYGGVMTVVSALEFPLVARIAVGPAVLFVAALLVGVAFLQQFGGYAGLPGSDVASMGGSVRPSSLTGSYLHYPLALSLMIFLLLGQFQATRRPYLLVAAAVSAAAVVLSFSRSGMLILAASVMVFLVVGVKGHTRVRAMGVAALGSLVLWMVSAGSVYFDRALSSLDPEGAGNAVRIAQWRHAVEAWVDSPWILGSRTGVVTNVTANLSSTTDSFVVESGVLQQVVNFGLLGAVAFYAILVVAVRATDRRLTWVRAGLYGAIIQSAVYQSIEVFPFMATFALVVLVSGQRSLDVAEQVSAGGAGSIATAGMQC